ncbi:TPA: SDR family NAD(P)-dependent oxidoreductase [Pseudomonas putida]|jgi:NAD(P)-dependent dehydrogenase (short-subunit alcohol dehydrogenase family)|uniref:Short-chain dehydrogenase/reductase SDR n=1 Tax=Pseudomonas putida (strain GB-1) TaxID=76869 RepID=B0KLM3_PSEPG|nr:MULTISPECIES: SDR family NAD(P)-dependent oxidoreductase [Pseudomonas]ABY98000.1 short-chain dehydrogenase/reductase SDR [Pseudomonas putida GB-1]APE98365.1 short-chain dehydrogenase [Pseudomonas putida]MBP0709806.1 SDR family NAD(P)-dependent oxidoreductase [Pseudomonas sp. T34]MCE1004576.1 SDR family NAD(P)-dependent oxidoreductase [Pseudomonas sp. NMI1173_11]MCK2189253.1 SDR family NAD(P)-dependent oxidoreductase [Pseudomonas sp. MB04B]
MSRCWLTGASSGMGAALALHLLEQGHQVALGARRADKLTALAERFPDQVLLAVGDIDQPGQVARIAEQIEHAWGALDQVILNAGTCEYLEPGHFDPALIDRVIRTNLTGTSLCLAAALPLLRHGQRPHLVVMGSSVSWLALPRAGAYGASKAALRYLVESLRIDLVGEGIDVTLVCPGFVDTPLTRRNDFPMPQLWSAERAAAHIIARLPHRPLEIAFPATFTLVLRLLGALPARWRLKLGRRLARQPQG